MHIFSNDEFRRFSEDSMHKQLKVLNIKTFISRLNENFDYLKGMLNSNQSKINKNAINSICNEDEISINLLETKKDSISIVEKNQNESILIAEK